MSKRRIFDFINIAPDECYDLTDFIDRLVVAREEVTERDGTFDHLFCQDDEVTVRFTRMETQAEVDKRTGDDKRMGEAKKRAEESRLAKTLHYTRESAKQLGYKLVKE